MSMLDLGGAMGGRLVLGGAIGSAAWFGWSGFVTVCRGQLEILRKLDSDRISATTRPNDASARMMDSIEIETS